MYNQPIMTEVKTADAVIEKKATLIYWVFIEPLQAGSKSTLKVYDGGTAAGKEVARFVVEYGRMVPCYPPIRCAFGVYIDIDAWVSSYTIGYLPEKVAKGQEFQLNSES